MKIWTKNAVLSTLERANAELVLAVEEMSRDELRRSSDQLVSAFCHLEQTRRHLRGLTVNPEHPTKPEQLALQVPTYNGKLFAEGFVKKLRPEFGDPKLPILVREAEGVRIILGSHDYGDSEKPDVQIERQPYGWVIFLQPVGGSDSIGYFYILDDGRSFFQKERAYGSTPPLQVLEPGEFVHGFDPPL